MGIGTGNGPCKLISRAKLAVDCGVLQYSCLVTTGSIAKAYCSNHSVVLQYYDNTACIPLGLTNILYTNSLFSPVG